MELNEVRSCVTVLNGDFKLDNQKFQIHEIELDGEEMSPEEENISCLISSSTTNI